MEIDGRGLKLWRETRGWSMAQLGRLLDVPANTVYRWELQEDEPKHGRGIRHGRMLALALWALEHGAGAEDDEPAPAVE